MSKSFKLIEDKFSEIDNEQRWTYELKIVFNYQLIRKITITDHYLNHRNVISNQLIIELLEEINGEILEPTKYQGKRKVFKWETEWEVNNKVKKYRLIFWFKDNENNHLWVRNCYLID